jgi:hypothetical protein
MNYCYGPMLSTAEKRDSNSHVTANNYMTSFMIIEDSS